MADIKTVPTENDVAAFLATLEDTQQQRESEELVGIMQEVSGKPPVMWGPSIIGFGSQHYKYASGREGDMPVIGFSPRKGKFAFYLTYNIERYKDQLEKVGNYQNGKACIYFKRIADVDKSELKELIRQTYADESKKAS
jgi:hypothetical protein